jgi:hypothetical protein
MNTMLLMREPPSRKQLDLDNELRIMNCSALYLWVKLYGPNHKIILELWDTYDSCVEMNILQWYLYNDKTVIQVCDYVSL